MLREQLVAPHRPPLKQVVVEEADLGVKANIIEPLNYFDGPVRIFVLNVWEKYTLWVQIKVYRLTVEEPKFCLQSLAHAVQLIIRSLQAPFAEASKSTFFKNVKTKIFIFKYFLKNPSEMNSNQPFYPILIPNTSYVKFSLFFVLVVGGSQKSNQFL